MPGWIKTKNYGISIYNMVRNQFNRFKIVQWFSVVRPRVSISLSSRSANRSQHRVIVCAVCSVCNFFPWHFASFRFRIAIFFLRIRTIAFVHITYWSRLYIYGASNAITMSIEPIQIEKINQPKTHHLSCIRSIETKMLVLSGNELSKEKTREAKSSSDFDLCKLCNGNRDI